MLQLFLDILGDLFSSVIRFGTALAIVISWSVSHSIPWTILQGAFGWAYVFYFALTRAL